jgi:chitosanase
MRFLIPCLFALYGCDAPASDPAMQDTPGGPGGGADSATPDPGTGNPGGGGDLGTAPGSPDLAGPVAPGDQYLTANQKAVAEAMTSIWENDTPKLDYAYSENINDGRGYTSGRAGFCTGTGDAIQVIACYDMLRSAANGNLMAKYMPALMTIDQKFQSTGQDQGSTAPLDAVGNWIADWGTSYNDATTRADFKKCQDQISDLLYYMPAMQAAASFHLDHALTKAALYDMWINQGDDTLVKQTNTAVGAGATEDAWLKKFLELRRDLLAGDPTWATSVDRVAGYEKARRRNNYDLAMPIDSAVKAKECWPTGNYKDSGYTAYTIQPDATWANSTAATSCN